MHTFELRLESLVSYKLDGNVRPMNKCTVHEISVYLIIAFHFCCFNQACDFKLHPFNAWFLCTLHCMCYE